MTILVTGAKGQVGSACMQLAAQRGIPATGFSSSELDITKPTAVGDAFAAVAPSAVVNCAAYTAVDAAEENQALAHAVNADGASILAEHCNNHGCELIHISTDYVFDGNKPTAYVETDATNPQNVYGKSKLAGEQALADHAARYLIVRASWVFSNIGRSFVDTMLRLGAERDELSVVNDQSGAPCYAKSLGDALLTLATRTHGLEHRGIYHFTSEPETNWHAFACRIFARGVALGRLERAPKVKAIPSSEFPTKASRPTHSKLAGDKLKRDFGIAPADWHADLDDCLGGEQWGRSKVPE